MCPGMKGHDNSHSPSPAQGLEHSARISGIEPKFMLALHPARQISALAARWRRSFSRSFMPRVRISAQRGPDHLPEDSYGSAGRRLHADVQMQVYTHRSASSSIVVPAVAEPMWVLVLSGAARVQERAFGQAWSAHDVGPDDFFLTMTHEPYPMQCRRFRGSSSACCMCI